MTYEQEKWLLNAVYGTRLQLASVERKVNRLLRSTKREKKLGKLAKTLDASTDTLEAAVEANQPQQEGNQQ